MREPVCAGASLWARWGPARPSARYWPALVERLRRTRLDVLLRSGTPLGSLGEAESWRLLKGRNGRLDFGILEGLSADANQALHSGWPGLYIPGDVHFSERGNRLAGETIARLLLEMDRSGRSAPASPAAD